MALKITGVKLVGNSFPIAGKKYNVGRITGVEGDLPKELAALTYNDETEKISPIEVPEGSPMANIGAVYVLLDTIDNEDGTITLNTIGSYEEFLSPFEFPKETEETFESHWFGKRCDDAQVKGFDLEIADSDTGEAAICKAFYSIEEMAYIASGVHTLAEFFRPDRIAALQSDTPVMMIFAESLTKAIDVYNQINFYDKAKDFAKAISDIVAINQDGEKTSLTMSAVNDFFKMVQDNIKIK